MTRLRCRPHNVSRLAAGSVLILSILLTSILPLPVAGQTSRSEDDDCDGQVVSLPVTNVTISTGQAKRGIELQLGSPLNSFAFAPDADEDVLTVKAIASAPSCPKLPGSPTGQTCRYMSGGLFDLSPNSATTLTGPVNDGFDGQGRLDRLRVASYTWDGFAFVSRFKQGVSSSDQALLGLRQGSTVLEEFVKRKIIGTRTWALDYGMSGEPESGMGPWVDGAITFGGYDKGRFVGSLSSEISVKGGTGCGLEVDVMSMVLNRPSGEKTPLFKNGEKKTACISTKNPLIELQPSMFDVLNKEYSSRYKYTQETNSTDSSRWTPRAGLYPFSFRDIDPKFDGNLTITLSNGFTTTIPNSELVKPAREADSTGKPYINSTAGYQRRFLVSRWEEEKEAGHVISLGTPFLTAAYLVVDYEKMKFRLGTPSRMAGSSDVKLNIVESQPKETFVPILPASCPQKDGVESTSNDEAEASTAMDSGSKKDGLGTGAIVGIVVGALGAVTLIGVGVYLLWWRRRDRYGPAKNDMMEKDDVVYDCPRPIPPVYVEADAGALPHEVEAASALHELGDTEVASQGYYRK